MERTVLYLDEVTVTALTGDVAAAREAVAAAFAAHRAEPALSRPKLSLDVRPGHAFQSMCAASPALGFAVNKWYGLTEHGIDACLSLNDFATGRLLAVMDGNAFTGVRTAAMSAAAAMHLVSPGSRTIGFVGCGLQAGNHLAAFRAALPSLVAVQAFSRTRTSAERLVAKARAMGLDAVATEDCDGLLAACDIVVTSVPMRPGFRPFLDARRLKPGAFVAAVDVGRSWIGESLAAFDTLAIDDRSQAGDYAPILSARPEPGYDADLAMLCAGEGGRPRPGGRSMFLFRGFALADLAVAALVYRRALEAGAGLRLGR